MIAPTFMVDGSYVIGSRFFIKQVHSLRDDPLVEEVNPYANDLLHERLIVKVRLGRFLTHNTDPPAVLLTTSPAYGTPTLRTTTRSRAVAEHGGLSIHPNDGCIMCLRVVRSRVTMQTGYAP